MERSLPLSERRMVSGGLHLYVGPTAKWRIDLVEADRPEAFDVRSRSPVLTAADVDSEGVKDPWVAMVGPLYYMVVSYAPRPNRLTEQDAKSLHATGDVYNTGLTKSSSGLALSEDGVHWRWQGELYAPADQGWDSWCSRLGSIVYVPPVYWGFYDGGRRPGGELRGARRSVRLH